MEFDESNTDAAINAIRLPRWIRAAGKDIGTFFSSGNCGDPQTGTEDGVEYVSYSYDLGCAWENAGNASAAVQ